MCMCALTRVHWWCYHWWKTFSARLQNLQLWHFHPHPIGNLRTWRHDERYNVRASNPIHSKFDVCMSARRFRWVSRICRWPTDVRGVVRKKHRMFVPAKCALTKFLKYVLAKDLFVCIHTYAWHMLSRVRSCMHNACESVYAHARVKYVFFFRMYMHAWQTSYVWSCSYLQFQICMRINTLRYTHTHKHRIISNAAFKVSPMNTRRWGPTLENSTNRSTVQSRPRFKASSESWILRSRAHHGIGSAPTQCSKLSRLRTQL